MKQFNQKSLNINVEADIDSFIKRINCKEEEKVTIRQIAQIIFKYEPIYAYPLQETDVPEILSLYENESDENREILFADMIKGIPCSNVESNPYIALLLNLKSLPILETKAYFQNMITLRIMFQDTKDPPPLVACCIM